MSVIPDELVKKLNKRIIGPIRYLDYIRSLRDLPNYRDLMSFPAYATFTNAEFIITKKFIKDFRLPQYKSSNKNELDNYCDSNPSTAVCSCYTLLKPIFDNEEMRRQHYLAEVQRVRDKNAKNNRLFEIKRDKKNQELENHRKTTGWMSGADPCCKLTTCNKCPDYYNYSSTEGRNANWNNLLGRCRYRCKYTIPRVRQLISEWEHANKPEDIKEPKWIPPQKLDINCCINNISDINANYIDNVRQECYKTIIDARDGKGELYPNEPPETPTECSANWECSQFTICGAEGKCQTIPCNNDSECPTDGVCSSSSNICVSRFSKKPNITTFDESFMTIFISAYSGLAALLVFMVIFKIATKK